MKLNKFLSGFLKKPLIFLKSHFFQELSIAEAAVIIVGIVIIIFAAFSINNLSKNKNSLAERLKKVSKDLVDLKNQDQYKINQDLSATISAIQKTYKQSVSLYEKLLDLKTQIKDTKKYDELLAQAINYLADKNYSSASATLTDLANGIQSENDKLAAAAAASGLSSAQIANVPQNNSAPGSGFSQQKVNVDGADFLVDIIAADLNSTRVIVDTASDGDCSNNCPVMSLGDYVGRSGAFAGINGTYFCPAEYPSCAGKTGSFDLLVMNKNKVYFNSGNNVYSTNPAVIFGSGFIRFVGQALEWGRDTGVDGVISNYPLLISGGNIAYSDNPDPKFNSKGPRSFVASKGNTIFIGYTFNATMGDSAKVMKALGMDNAMNLDEGGSSALWFGGYKVGPGRNIPNALLFVRK